MSPKNALSSEMSGWNACVYQCTTVQWCGWSVSFRTNWFSRHLNMFAYSFFFLILWMWAQMNHHTSISSFQNCKVGSNLREILYQAKIKAEIAAFWNFYCLFCSHNSVTWNRKVMCSVSLPSNFSTIVDLCFQKRKSKVSFFEALIVVLANDLPEGF